MLIDGGNTGDSGKLIQYLKNIGVEKIDIIIATHPHEDHIGGLSEIIRKFETGKIYMPKVQANTLALRENAGKTCRSENLQNRLIRHGGNNLRRRSFECKRGEIA